MKQFYQQTIIDIRSGVETWRVLVSTSLFAFAASFAASLIMHG
jgi:hypothetical protein